MNDWAIQYTAAAKEDLKELDGSTRCAVVRSIKKVSKNPLPYTEGGYGKPLGHNAGSNLTGCLKIKLKRYGIRIVYQLKRTERGMEILIIGARAESEVYIEAEKRIAKQNG